MNFLCFQVASNFGVVRLSELERLFCEQRFSEIVLKTFSEELSAWLDGYNARKKDDEAAEVKNLAAFARSTTLTLDWICNCFVSFGSSEQLRECEK